MSSPFLRSLSLATCVVALFLATTARADNGDCGQPTSDGEDPVAGDCLYILRTGVGSVECDPCVCDTNGNGETAASDALLCLRVAVGQPVALECDACTVTLTVKNYLSFCEVSIDGGELSSQSSQTVEVPKGEAVLVFAQGGSGFEFGYWRGTDADQGGPSYDTQATTHVTANADKTIQACCWFAGIPTPCGDP
jgi:hypothetical protein